MRRVRRNIVRFNRRWLPFGGMDAARAALLGAALLAGMIAA